MIRTITVFDTSVSTDNLGDGIIMDAVNDVIAEVFPKAYANRVATHDFMGPVSRKLVAASDLCIIGGTNLLDPDALSKGALWKVTAGDLFRLHDVVLLGVGWRKYTSPPKALTRRAYSRILSKRFTSSVRDSYTLDHLKCVDAPVANTTCVTMWKLTPEHMAQLPRRKAETVVTTLTFYSPRPTEDVAMLETLKRLYKRVKFWPQQSRDREYFDSLGVGGIDLVDPRLAAFNAALDEDSVDFVGTRLHAGVRSLQKSRRALIIAIDNRAAEISKDTGLPVCKRGDVPAIENWVREAAPIVLSLPTKEIDFWKSQFGAPTLTTG